MVNTPVKNLPPAPYKDISFISYAVVVSSNAIQVPVTHRKGNNMGLIGTQLVQRLTPG